MENREEKNLPIEATEKAITTGNFGKNDIDKAANKMSKQVKEVEKIKEGKTNEEAKAVVEQAVAEVEMKKEEEMVK